METIINFIQQSLSYVGPFLLLLGLLIFIHELGHFLVAKYFKVRVEVFSLGFGPKLLKFKKGDTTYCFSLFPLGGYVKMFGDNPRVTIPVDQQKYSFLHKPVWPRIAIVIAGPLMNLFFAIIVFTTVALVGEKFSPPLVGDIARASEAYAQGFRSGDKILSLDKKPMENWTAVSAYLKDRPHSQITARVIREKRQVERTISFQTTMVQNNNPFGWQQEVGGVKGLSPASQASIVGVPRKNSLAFQKGIRSLDHIIAINDEPIEFFRQIKLQLKKISGPLKIKVRSHKTERERVVSFKNWKPQKNLLRQLGFEKPDQYIMAVKDDSPAMAAQLQPGDKIQKIDGQKIAGWKDVLNKIKGYKEEKGIIAIAIVRNGENMVVPVTPKVTSLINQRGQDDKRYTVGIYPAIAMVLADPIVKNFRSPIWASLVRGVGQTIHWTEVTILSLWKLLTNQISHRNVAGVLTIGKVAGETYKAGINAFLRVMGIISINLFLLNLLPVPVLDGGHLMFFLIEAIKGRPVSLKKMEIAQQIGLVLLMSLMGFALINDIANIFNPPW